MKERKMDIIEKQLLQINRYKDHKITLKDAVEKKNLWALKVNSLEEKPTKDKLIKMIEQRESMCKDVLDMVNPIVKKLRKLSVEIQKSEDKIYKISGEWGLDEILLKINTPYYSYFWDVSDGYLNGEQGY
tara:strand:- start:605 stop:994 length:390 start_codon:yes stop_codon:yes gene_type:complete